MLKTVLSFLAALSADIWALSRFVAQQRPRTLGLVAALLLVAGGGAYAVAAAVVSMVPEPSRTNVREVREIVQPLALDEQVAAQSQQHFSLYRSDSTRGSDSAESLLRRLGLDDPQAADFLRRDPLSYGNLLGRTGRQVTVEATERNTLRRLTARWSPDDDGSFKRLVIERDGSGLSSRLETARLSASVRIASAVIESSLFGSTDAAGIPDSVAVQLAEIFSGDIDFHRELRRGDRYAVVYEVLEGDGEPLRAGRVLSAEFTNNGKTYQALWFQEPGAGGSEALSEGEATHTRGHGGYYNLAGLSLKRSFLASPLAFSRITSGFKMRFHPILQKWTAHLGVDYAAPVGTPVRATADGIVEFAGVQNGYGNVVYLRHRNNQVTVYAHLSRIFVHVGQHVDQSANIAASGASGWATGPHLHYEYRLNGKYQNPLTMARNSDTEPVSASARPAFNRLAAQVREQLTAAEHLAER